MSRVCTKAEQSLAQKVFHIKFRGVERCDEFVKRVMKRAGRIEIFWRFSIRANKRIDSFSPGRSINIYLLLPLVFIFSNPAPPTFIFLFIILYIYIFLFFFFLRQFLCSRYRGGTVVYQTITIAVIAFIPQRALNISYIYTSFAYFRREFVCVGTNIGGPYYGCKFACECIFRVGVRARHNFAEKKANYAWSFSNPQTIEIKIEVCFSLDSINVEENFGRRNYCS